jgi:hypothetical protein
MPIRWYKYHKIGFHYFLADLCYFVNMLLVLSIWFFPPPAKIALTTNATSVQISLALESSDSLRLESEARRKALHIEEIPKIQLNITYSDFVPGVLVEVLTTRKASIRIECTAASRSIALPISSIRGA